MYSPLQFPSKAVDLEAVVCQTQDLSIMGCAGAVAHYLLLTAFIMSVTDAN